MVARYVDTMPLGSWFLPQLHHAIQDGGKNRGKAKAEKRRITPATPTSMQDKFHEHMAQEFTELERGESAAVTKRKHVPTWLYKQANRLTEQMEQMKMEIQCIGTFNAQKKKESLLDMFCKWYPRINAFENQLKPYATELEILHHNENVLRSNKEQAEWVAQKV